MLRNKYFLECFLLYARVRDELYCLFDFFFQTSNGTLVGNANLIEFEEHQLNDLDLIVLANDDEGVVLQFMDKVDQTIDLLNFDVSLFFFFLVICILL